MIRDVDLAAVSDGRLYRSRDLVKADTGGCHGCSLCCHEMCDTIALDPLDVFHIRQATGKSFEELMEGFVRLDLADGLILPFPQCNPDTGACVFLSSGGRCTIHGYRPGFCRLFPLGRVYAERNEQKPEECDFHYFLQVNECPHAKTKVRISRWLGIPDLEEYERFVRRWHAFWLDACKEADSGDRKAVSMAVLTLFYLTDWDMDASFYLQFEERLAAGRERLKDYCAADSSQV